MRAAVARAGLLVLACVGLVAWGAIAEPFASVRVAGLSASTPSVPLPIDGVSVGSGAITISLGHPSLEGNTTFWDRATTVFPIQWPAAVACDLFRSHGVTSREITLYGFVRQLQDGSVGDVDVGVLNYTDSGDRVVVININKIIIQSLRGPSTMALDALQAPADMAKLLTTLDAQSGRMQISGSFEGFTGRDLAAWPELASDIERAIASVPDLPDLPPGFSERIYRHFLEQENPNELAMYFLDTDVISSSDLAGTLVIDVGESNWYDVLDSFEGLLDRQAERLLSFEDLVKSVWNMIPYEEKIKLLHSFEVLLEAQADRLASFEHLLEALRPSPENIRYIESFEKLLVTQGKLLESFEFLMENLAYPSTW